jgi:hypothetical protein
MCHDETYSQCGLGRASRSDSGIADVSQPDGPLLFEGWTIPNAPVIDSSRNACAIGPWKRRLPSAKATRGVRSAG